MNRWARILKHRWHDESDVRRVLGPAALDRIGARVSASERGHSGEIRVCVEAGLPLSYLWRDAAPRERALAMFGKLRVWDTAHNNGVLIYLLLAERSIEIVADRGLSRHVPREHWQQVAQGMSADFKAGRFEEGLGQAIDAVHDLLCQHYALQPDAANPNELPDRPYVR